MTSSSKSPRRRSAKIAAGLALAAALAGGVAACGSSGGSSISLVAYSTPGPAYTGKLIPAFKKTSQGNGTSFTTSFGASGDQSRAVEAGQPAVVQPASGSDALSTFTAGKGDVLLTYESDAIAAKKAGEDVDYLTPSDTILIQTPLAATKDASTAAKDFVKWEYTPEAQQIW